MDELLPEYRDVYMERYAKGVAPDYQIIHLYLIRNIFFDDVATKVAELGIELPA